MHPSALVGILAFAAAVSGVPTHPPVTDNLKSHIKNVVILEMENRSLDNILGGQKVKGLDNSVNNGPFCNPVNLTDPSQGQECTAAKDFDSVLDDPDHAVTGNNIEFYGTFTPDNDAIAQGTLTPSQKGFLHEQRRRYPADSDSTSAKELLHYYTPEQVPVFSSLVKNFVTFNHWHTGVPGPTDPNRAALLSGTSAGHGKNDATFTSHGLTQKSIFEQLSNTGHSWKHYYMSISMVDAFFFNWTFSSGNVDKAQPLKQFYDDAAAGVLPEFSFIDPSCCSVRTNSMHPSGLVSDGETFIKDVYEALRSSPKWDQTLLILTFDETGGFFDHVPAPLAPRPDNLTYTEQAPSGEQYTFTFNRLGGRVPTLLISPWVGTGVIEQKGTNSAGDTVSYCASSILRTLGDLWDFAPFTPRVAWAPPFGHLIGSSPRSDTPQKLPDPVKF